MLWLSVHLGQLAPTTLPQCQLVSNSRSAGLSLSLRVSLSLSGLGFLLRGGGVRWTLQMKTRLAHHSITVGSATICPTVRRPYTRTGLVDVVSEHPRGARAEVGTDLSMLSKRSGVGFIHHSACCL